MNAYAYKYLISLIEVTEGNKGAVLLQQKRWSPICLDFCLLLGGGGNNKERVGEKKMRGGSTGCRNRTRGSRGGQASKREWKTWCRGRWPCRRGGRRGGSFSSMVSTTQSTSQTISSPGKGEGGKRSRRGGGRPAPTPGLAIASNTPTLAPPPCRRPRPHS